MVSFKGSIHALRLKAAKFFAQRLVPRELALKQIEEDIPSSWRGDEVLWRYVIRHFLAGSGIGFVSPPYTTMWEKIWGTTPIEDLPKYKDLYTFTPYIKSAIDVTANLVTSRGFDLQGGQESVRQFLTDWMDKINILETLRIVATDMLTFGNAYMEICSVGDQPPEEWWLKPLDPVHMRVRRDAYGNVFGYIQLLTFPPVAFTSEEAVHFRYGGKSWWYESAYGTSILRPLLKIQALIDQFEDDMAIIVHTYAKPMLIVKAGTAERPWSDAQLTALAEAFANRKVASDLFVRGDVDVQVIPSLTKDVNIEWWLDYLYRQREFALGVPRIFAGHSEGTNRATAEVVLQEYLSRLRVMQEMIADQLESVLFKQIITRKFGEGTEIPKIKWHPILEIDPETKSKMVTLLLEYGVVTVDEARAEMGYKPRVEAVKEEVAPEVKVERRARRKLVDDVKNAILDEMSRQAESR